MSRPRTQLTVPLADAADKAMLEASAAALSLSVSELARIAISRYLHSRNRRGLTPMPRVGRQRSGDTPERGFWGEAIEEGA
jgi:hypothetical protein